MSFLSVDNQYKQQDLHKEANHQQELEVLLSNSETQNQIGTSRTNQVNLSSSPLNLVPHSNDGR